jgi:signal transduction histidine kinase
LKGEIDNGGRAVIKIEDNGPGVKEEMKEIIFHFSEAAHF